MSSRLALIASVGESMTHIVEPVASQVLQFVVDKLGYSELFKDNIELVSDFRSVSTTTDDNGHAKIIANRVRAKLNPNVNPTSNKWDGNGTTMDLGNGNTLVMNPRAGQAHRMPINIAKFSDRHCSIFTDSLNYIDLTEMTTGTTLTMEVKFTFKYMVDAQECLSRVFHCFTNGENIGYVDIQYDYPLPYNIQTTLNYLFKLRGPRDGVENDTALKWVLANSGGAITLLQNRNKPQTKEVVINKNQMQAMFMIECSQEAPTTASPDGAEITMNITLQYARANRLVLEYPIIVNNNYVDFKYVPTKPEFRQAGDSPVMWQNPEVTKYWKSLYQNWGRVQVNYPWWDDWSVPPSSAISKYGYETLCCIAFTLDNYGGEQGSETVIDLKDGLPGIKLSEEILTYIKENPEEVLMRNDLCKFNVSVFAEDCLVDFEAEIVKPDETKIPLLEIKDDHMLHIRATRKNTLYRLVIGINDNPDTTRRKARDSMNTSI